MMNILSKIKRIYLFTIGKIDGRFVTTLVAAALLFHVYCMIFSFSDQDATTSSSVSQRLSEKCVDVMQRVVGFDWSEGYREELSMYFEHPIRKIAHFAEYTIVGLLVYCMWRPWWKKGKKLYFLVALWVFCSAAADEFHQTFVPGRYGCFADVLLDTSGGLFAIFLCLMAEKIYDKYHRMRTEK